MVILFICAVLFSYCSIKAFLFYSNIPYIAFIGLLIYALFFKRYLNKKNLIWMLFLLGYEIFSVIATDGGLGSLLIQFYIISMILVTSNIKYTRISLKILFCSAFLVWAIWIVKSRNYFTYFSHSLAIGKDVVNSNTVAEVLLITFSICMVYKDLIRIPFVRKRLFTFLMAGFTIFGIQQCKSRTTLAAMALFLIISFLIPEKFWTRKRILAVTFMIMAFGVIFPVLYLMLQNYEKFNLLVYQYTGRFAYTGREQIWTDYYRNFGNSLKLWALGIGSHAANNSLGSKWGTNVHNSYLAIQLNFGIIGLILFIGLIVRSVKNALSEEEEFSIFHYKLKCIFAFWVCLIIGYSEVTLVWSPMIPLSYMMLGMAQNKSIYQ